MDKLNKNIADVANILDNLMLADIADILDNLIFLRNILETGNCNNCNNRNCAFRPSWGQMVRYNCPCYEGHTGKKREDGKTIAEYIDKHVKDIPYKGVEPWEGR